MNYAELNKLFLESIGDTIREQALKDVSMFLHVSDKDACRIVTERRDDDTMPIFSYVYPKLKMYYILEYSKIIGSIASKYYADLESKSSYDPNIDYAAHNKAFIDNVLEPNGCTNAVLFNVEANCRCINFHAHDLVADYVEGISKKPIYEYMTNPLRSIIRLKFDEFMNTAKDLAFVAAHFNP